MEFKNMSVEDLEARKTALFAEIEGLPDTADVSEVATRTAEIDSINAELEARKATAAAKAAARAKVADGEGTHVKTFNKNEERKMFEISSPEYRSAWLKNLQGKPLTAEERDGFTQATTNAVPTLISDKFFEKMKKLAPMLSEITLLRVAGNIQFVAEGTRATADVHTENAAIDTSTDTTVKVSLGAFEFFKIVAISESARAMSIDAFEAWLIEMLAGDIARAIDNYILNNSTNGLVANTFTTGINQIVNTATTGYAYKDIIDLIAILPAAYDAESKFLTNKKTLYGQIANIVDSNDRPIFVESAEAGIQGRIMGYPVIVDDNVATTNAGVYLGKYTDIVGNLSQDINVISYPDYDYAQVKYRGGAFFDSKLAKNDAIVRLVSTTA